jgi:hypothetical protein
MRTKVPYPQVFRRLLETLNLPITVQSLHKAAEILQSRKADKMRLTSGEFEGCWDDERINKIAKEVLAQHPELQAIVDDCEEEDVHYSLLCGWLNNFIEKVAWLGGNRPWPCAEYLVVPVKSEEGCGILEVKDKKYLVFRYKRSDSLLPSRGKFWKSYNSALEMAFDGWSVD